MRKFTRLSFGTALLAGCAVAPTGQPPVPPAPTPTVAPKLVKGVVTTLKADHLAYAVDLAIDDQDNLYIAALDGIFKRSLDGTTREIAVVRNDAAFADVDPTTTISNPTCIAVDPRGNVWVDTFHQVFRIAPDGTQTGYAPFGPATGSGMVVDRDGNVYVVSSDDDTLHKLTPDGQWTSLAGANRNAQAPPGLVGPGYQDGPGNQALFRMPGDLAIDEQGVLYVADTNNTAIRKVLPDGTVSTVSGHPLELPPSPASGSPSPLPSSFTANAVAATSLALGPQGVIYATGRDNRIHLLRPDGTHEALAGDASIHCDPAPCLDVCPSPSPVDCHVDGTGSAARLSHPRGMVVTRSGSLIVLDGTTFGAMSLRQVD